MSQIGTILALLKQEKTGLEGQVSRVRGAIDALAAVSAPKKRAKKAKKKAVKKAVKRKRKSTEPTRYRLIWGVYSSSMREEARFDYDCRKDADKKAEKLKAKGKKLYWVQPIKEEIIPEPEADDA